MGRRLRWTAVLAAVALSTAPGAFENRGPEAEAATATANGLKARYFDREDLTLPKLTRTDARVAFDWGRGSPSSSIRPDTFSARWQGLVEAPRTGTYTFFTRSSDGVRLWVDGKLVISRWRAQSAGEWAGRVALRGGRRHTIKLEYFERSGSATARLLWSGPGVAKQTVPSSRLFPPPSPPPAPPPACSDGRDNDADAHIDSPADPGCVAASDTTESPNPAPPPDPVPEGTERWSDPGTWDGAGLPTAGQTVTIPAGKTVMLDRSTPPLAGLRVDGNLVFADDYLTLTSDWVMVHGKLQIGSATEPFSKRARIELTGTDSSQDVMGMGAKVLGVMGGTLDIHGERRDSWTKLDATAPKGATSLTFAGSPGWRAGDRIAISSTDYATDQAEEATITSVSGSTVKLSRPLDYEHFGARQSYDGRTVDERAEVALLSRNVKIEGEEHSSVDGFGGQIMVMGGGQARIEGAELTRMGQKNTLRRYPLHFHMLGDAGAGSYLKGSSIHHAYNRCLTIHGTNRLDVTGNACYDHVGHGYFFEDGAEVGNRLEGNLGFRTRRPKAGEQLLPSDRNAATFWITNPDNTVRGNVAGGSDGMGFWMALPEHPTGLSTDASVWPRRTPLREFSGNTAHSNGSDGLHVDSGPRPDGTTEGTDYNPRANSIPPPDGQPDSDPVEARFERFTGYKNRNRAVWLRGDNHRLNDAELADNAVGATFASHETALSNSLVVGETANRGTPYEWDASAGRVGTEGRALPRPWTPDFPIRGFEFYDGRVGAESTSFVNFTPNARREASALGYLLSNAFGVHPANYATGLRFLDSKRVYLPGPDAGRDGDASSLFIDRDGSVTGVPRGVVTANNPFLAEPGCLADPSSLRADWNAYACPETAYATLTAGAEGAGPSAIKPLRLTRVEDGKIQTLSGSTSSSTSAQSNVLPNREYGVEYNGGTPSALRFVLSRGAGKWAVLSVAYPVAPKVTKYGCDLAGASWCRGGAATSLADLRAKDRSAFWYDAAARRLYLKVFATDPNNPSRQIDYEELRVEPASGG